VLTYFRCVDGKVEKLDRFTPEALNDPKALHWVDLDTPTRSKRVSSKTRSASTRSRSRTASWT
jgi:hypothetical protein